MDPASYETHLAKTALQYTVFFLLTYGSLQVAALVFCIYGFCASFEPGQGLGWKIGYASVASLLLAAAIVQTVRVFGPRR